MMNKNSTDFTQKATEFVNKILADHKTAADPDTKILRYYQYVALKVLVDAKIDSRGLLIYHPMGTGKTRYAFMAALAMNRHVAVILDKSLQSNFLDTIKEVFHLTHSGPDVEKELQAIVKKFNFVSLDAYNLAQQADKLPGGLDNKLLIMDEAHNFFKAIINSKNDNTNARQLYHMIQTARNLKILFLTGTPVSKHPFEIVPCFNMLTRTELLPSQYDLFMSLYVDEKANSIKRVSKLADRLLGMVSHVTTDSKRRQIGGLPEILPLKIIRCEMSPSQYKIYLMERDKEYQEATREGLRVHKMQESLSMPHGGGGTFYVRSRISSNFAPSKKYNTLDEVPDEEINIENSVKMMAIVKNLALSKRPSIVYSQFVEWGINCLARYLKKAGYTKFKDVAHGRTYAVYTGDTPDKERIAIKYAFNDRDNINGAIISVLLLSEPGVQGLDLKYGDQAHIMEPYWDKSREEQFITRLVRMGSHDLLPESEREVQPYIYISVPNVASYEAISEEKRELFTVDERFHLRALRMMKLNLTFRALLRAVSIECTAYKSSEKCYTCIPTGQRLYYGRPESDMRKSPCERPVYVDTHEVSLDGTVYYYEIKLGVIKIYESYSSGNYVEIYDSDERYFKIVEKIKLAQQKL